MISSFGYKENKLPSPTPFSTSDLSGITSAVLDLLNCPDSGDGVLLEAFYRSFHPAVPTGIGRHAVNVGKTKHDFRVTTVVSRTPLDGARVTQVVCSIGDLCGSGIASSVPSSLEMTLRKWGITDTTQQKAIRDTVRGAAEKILLVLIDREKNATSTDRGAKEACTEILGVELVITKIDDVFIPVVTNIKAQGFLHQMSLFENINPVHRGQAARTWVQTMLFRSQKFIMKGKTLVIVGGGGYSNRQTWTDILDFGVKVVLVESDQDHFAKGQVHRFLHLDIDYHSRDLEHADVIVKFVQSQIGHVDGCLTFLEDNVPLASLVGEALHLPHTPSYKAAVAAKTKGLTQSVLFSTAPPLHVMPPSLCSSPVVRLNGVEDLHNAVKQVPLPAVMKFEYGMQAVGVKHVRTFEEALSHMQHVPTILGVKDGLGHGDSMVLMPRLLGTEHDVDIVLMEGQLMAGFVMDHGPTHEPMCSETVISSPSVLSGEQQRQLVAAAAASCTGIGLDTGVFAVEMMMTPRGPKLLEINARLGALYTRVFHRLIYGVDLLYLALMAACGVRPVAGSNIVSGYTSVQAREDNGQLIAFPLYPKRHGKALATSRLHDQGTILYLQFHEGIELRDDEFDQAFALLAVRAPTLEEARTKLLATCTALELETEDTMVEILQDLVFA
ncbi:hypothetical protein BaRGS_00018774 [Batillaria attramentaria]|uniref:ATP-grasp domain-containing protein n=1 Tax=Batillaria attramentaria TaxID=370345 RepID=A0ABD0KT33_9CAEN